MEADALSFCGAGEIRKLASTKRRCFLSLPDMSAVSGSFFMRVLYDLMHVATLCLCVYVYIHTYIYIYRGTYIHSSFSVFLQSFARVLRKTYRVLLGGAM